MGRKFVLPHYRQGDYYPQDVLNKSALAVMLMPALAASDRAVLDDVIRSQLLNNFAALACDRPVMFLERELGEILVATEIPGVVDASDIHFPFPSFRVMLPKGLIGIANGERWAMYLDIGHLENGRTWVAGATLRGSWMPTCRSQSLALAHSVYLQEDVVTISSQLDHGFASSYAVTKALKGTLEEMKAFKGSSRRSIPTMRMTTRSSRRCRGWQSTSS